jgi:hypothetical protein
MPAYTFVGPDRVEFSDPLTKSDIDKLAANLTIKVLQCSRPLNEANWGLLNSEFFPQRPDVQLRLYGFYTEVCDLSFVAGMDHVQHFAADCILNATGVEQVAEMPNLQSLEIGIYNLESFDFLWYVPAGLTGLLLGATHSKKPDLQPLSRFKKLTRIYLEGQQKNIDVLADLVELEDVTLRSISTPGLEYLSMLPRLWSLDIKLGGIRNLSAIAGMAGIKYLELWNIRGLEDIEVISHLPGLQDLFLQSLPLITAIPSLRESRQLRRVFLQNLKGLRDLSELQGAPALEEFILLQGEHQQVEDLLPVIHNPSLRWAAAYFGSIQKNKQFTRLLGERGIEEYVFSAFQYT